MEDNNASGPNADLEELLRNYRGPDKIPDEGTTTLMIRNLPRSYTPQAVMCELKTLCPESRYDFVYLPWDKRRSSNISFAFLNFVDAESSMRAFVALSGQAWTLVRSVKSCRVAAAHIQGLRENLVNYVTTAVHWGGEEEEEEEEGPHPPIVIQDGQMLELNEAVATLCTEEMLNQAKEKLAASKPPPLPGLASASSSSSGPRSGAALATDRTSELLTRAQHQRLCSMTEVARDFRESFLEFCQGISRRSREPLRSDLNSSEPTGDIANVDFWVNFHSLCLRFSEIPSSMPEVQEPDLAVHGIASRQPRQEMPRNVSERGHPWTSGDNHESFIQQSQHVYQNHNKPEDFGLARGIRPAPGLWQSPPRLSDDATSTNGALPSRAVTQDEMQIPMPFQLLTRRFQ